MPLDIFSKENIQPRNRSFSQNYMPHIKSQRKPRNPRGDLEGKVERSVAKPSGQVEKTTQPHRLSAEWGSCLVHSLALWCIVHIPVKTIHSKSSELRSLGWLVRSACKKASSLPKRSEAEQRHPAWRAGGVPSTQEQRHSLLNMTIIRYSALHPLSRCWLLLVRQRYHVKGLA